MAKDIVEKPSSDSSIFQRHGHVFVHFAACTVSMTLNLV